MALESIGGLPNEKDPIREYRVSADDDQKLETPVGGSGSGVETLSDVPGLRVILESAAAGIEKSLGKIEPVFDPKRIELVSSEEIEKRNGAFASQAVMDIYSDFGKRIGVNIETAYPYMNMLTDSLITGEICVNKEWLDEDIKELSSMDKDRKYGKAMDMLRNFTHEYVHQIGETKTIEDQKLKEDLIALATSKTADTFAKQMESANGRGEEARDFFLKRFEDIVKGKDLTVEVQGGMAYVSDPEGRVLINAGYNLNEELVETITDEIMKESLNYYGRKVGIDMSFRQLTKTFKALRDNGTYLGNKSVLLEGNVVGPKELELVLDGLNLYNLKRLIKAYMDGDIVEKILKMGRSDIIR